MKLKKILEKIPNCQVIGSEEGFITGICSHSVSVKSGDLFIAKNRDPVIRANYLSEAIVRGAVAVVTEAFEPNFSECVQVIHPAPSTIEGLLAANYYNDPSQELFTVGVTGTNGKTTTSFIVKSLLDYFQGPCGLIGTVKYIVGNRSYPATFTTPEAVTNQRLLKEMVNEGCRCAVMEVSSHALDQGRVEKVDFDVAIFTNLTTDHLDYHGTMENYGATKKRLFEMLGKEHSKKNKGKWAIVNQDSPWSLFMIENCTENVLTYGMTQSSDLFASDIRFENGETFARLTFNGELIECCWPLIGRFNVSNVLAAIAVLLTQNIPLKTMIKPLSLLSAVSGRLENVKNLLEIQIYVDFAHSDDSLLNVILTLRELKNKNNKIIVVFGCGGDRDRIKRPKMAEVCEQYADFSIVTTDNPRSEDPQNICAEICAGFDSTDSYHIELDRRKAIESAIDFAQTGDIVLIAGKGHETSQIFAHETIEFDDFKVASAYADLCAQRRAR